MARIFLSAPDVGARERELVAEAFASNYIAPAGGMLDRFERDMEVYTGIKHAVAVSSGTAAMHLALRISGIHAGDEVWTTSMTFIGGVSPIVFQHAVPVFFDLDPASWTIDIELIAQELTKAARTGKLPKAIIPTDLYGQPCDIQRLVKVASRYEIPVLSDSAEALGAFIHGCHAGKGAKAAVLSFNGNKIITTSGGGMLLSDDKAMIDKARYLSTQAREPFPHYEHVEVGYNYRMSNICAAIGIGQLELIETKVARRREIFARYHDALSAIPGIAFMPEASGARASRWLTCITVDPTASGVTRHAVQETCERADIEVRPLWKPMHLQPVFAKARSVGGQVSERFFETGLCLPSGSGMSNDDQDRVIEALNAAFKVGGRQA